MATKQEALPEDTAPGDVIELALTVEIIDKRGRKQWAKAGLSSTHRPNETSEEAVERVQNFVIQSIDYLQDEANG